MAAAVRFHAVKAAVKTHHWVEVEFILTWVDTLLHLFAC